MGVGDDDDGGDQQVLNNSNSKVIHLHAFNYSVPFRSINNTAYVDVRLRETQVFQPQSVVSSACHIHTHTHHLCLGFFVPFKYSIHRLLIQYEYGQDTCLFDDCHDGGHGSRGRVLRWYGDGGDK